MDSRIELDVEGMTCDSCERHVTHALEAAGARDVAVSWRDGTARFLLAEGADEALLRASVEAAGYRPADLRVVGGTAAAEEPASAPSPDGDVDYDLVVLGAGSAAFAAAITARDAGRTVAVVEAATVGGTCVNVGCVPSKALLRAGELYHAAGHHPFAGLETTAGEVDLLSLVAQKDELVAALRQQKYLDLVDAYAFDVIPGRGRFVDARTVAVGDRNLRARAFLIATGASPAVPPIPGLEEAGYLTSTTALDLKQRPDRLVVVGANAVGLELGQFFGHLGAQVTFFDIADRIAPLEEPEASAALTAVLEDERATVHAPAQIHRVERDGDVRTVVTTVDGREVVVEADEILVATGRRPNTADLGLDAAGVDVDGRGAIPVDGRLRTTNPRVWAAGDVVAGVPQFVYVSAYHGSVAAGNALLGDAREVDYRGLPRVTFTTPQLAGAGLTEAQARDAGHEVRTSVLGLEHVPRALVNRDTRGIVKLVADATSSRLLGATMVADGAGDAIQAAVLAIRHGLTVDELAATFHPYLTMAEAWKLAAQTFGRDVTRLSCCAA